MAIMILKNTLLWYLMVCFCLGLLDEMIIYWVSLLITKFIYIYIYYILYMLTRIGWLIGGSKIWIIKGLPCILLAFILSIKTRTNWDMIRRVLYMNYAFFNFLFSTHFSKMVRAITSNVLVLLARCSLLNNRF